MNNCIQCAFYKHEGCAVNPGYWSMVQTIGRLNRQQQDAIRPYLQFCASFNDTIPF